ncbi:hypothetical protein OC834_002526 [Tilletia horrida]|nr:hypothetical protein OC834_002526 [Tilletia horrida]
MAIGVDGMSDELAKAKIKADVRSAISMRKIAEATAPRIKIEDQAASPEADER